MKLFTILTLLSFFSLLSRADTNTWLNRSVAYSSAPTAGVGLITQTDRNLNQQEFFAKFPQANVPESANLLLLGSGLAGIASLLKKRNRP